MSQLPADQDVRDQVVRDFDTTFLLEAGAGTGKTTVLVARILAIVRSGRSTLDRIVAITFTEKAAGELKLRLRDGIEEALARASDPVERERLLAATHDLERAPVSTIHAFTGALLRERPFEAGLDPGFRVAAEIAGERVLDDAWDAWLDARMLEADPVLLRALTLDLKLADLRKAARRMVNERDVLASVPPRPHFDPASLVERVRSAVATLQPLKPRCTDTDDDAYGEIVMLEAFLARAERAQGLALERLLRDLAIDTQRGQQGNWSPAQACRDVKAELKSLKDAQAAYVRASSADVAWTLRDRLRGFLDAYETAKRDRAVVDYTDLLIRARDVLLRSVPVRRYFQGRFDFVLVDEFQDTDPLQAQIAFLLAEDPSGPPAEDWRAVRLAPGKLFVVGDPKQSIYRFRRADIAVYEEVKRLMKESGGVVLPLTANFRTVPSVLAFVNERFQAVFSGPGDPEPRPLDAFRPEVASDGARTIALPLPSSRLTDDRRVETIRPVLAETVVAFIEEVTRTRPWSVRDGDSVRAARPGDVGLLVRKMTPEFIGPFEDHFDRRGIPYRLVGGKEYYAREEVQSLTAVLRAIDNPQDRLAVFAALRSPFFGLSDDDVFQFATSGGILNPLAPIGPDVRSADVVAPIFEVLAALHRMRRVAPPSEVITALFERTRALPTFRLRSSGDQNVANLWKVLDVARAYESAGPATLRAVVRFLQSEAQTGREEGDSPVGEQAGAQVEVLTVHTAKGLESPIVIVADVLSERLPYPDVIVRHATGEGWLKIGRFEPAGWGQASQDEQAQQAAEERRLLYVALTRARDHLVIPCFPDARRPAWLDSAIAGFAVDGREPAYGSRTPTIGPAGAAGVASVTWFDSRAIGAVAPAPSRPASATVAIDGDDAAERRALAAEQSWETARLSRRAAARQVARPVEAATAGARSLPLPLGVAAPTEDAATELADDPASAPPPPAPFDPRAESFGRLVHALLALPLLAPSASSGPSAGPSPDLAASARTLAPQFGLGDPEAVRAADLVRRASALPEIAAAATADAVHRELPFAVPIGGVLTTGRIDLAYRVGGAWTVIEFKTSAFADRARALESYGSQLSTYRDALAAITGEPVRAALCLLGSGELVGLD